jgi:hypothetical protein
MNTMLGAENTWRRRLHEILFSLNIGIAIMLTLSIFTYMEYGPRGSAAYILFPADRMFIDAAVWANRILGVHKRASGAGWELACFAFVLLPATMVFTLLSAFAQTAVVRAMLKTVAGFTSVLLVPAFWFYGV